MKKLLIIIMALVCMAQTRPSISENFDGDDQEYKDYIQKLYVKVNNPNSTNIQKNFKDTVNSEHKRLFPDQHRAPQPVAQPASQKQTPAATTKKRTLDQYPEGNPLRYGEQYGNDSGTTTRQPAKQTANTPSPSPIKENIKTDDEPPKEPKGIIDLICSITEQDLWRFACCVTLSTSLAFILLPLHKLRKIRGQTNV